MVNDYIWNNPRPSPHSHHQTQEHVLPQRRKSPSDPQEKARRKNEKVLILFPLTYILLNRCRWYPLGRPLRRPCFLSSLKIRAVFCRLATSQGMGCLEKAWFPCLTKQPLPVSRMWYGIF